MRIKNGDTVQLITGKKKGKRSKVISVDRTAGKVTLEKVNTVIKHVKPNKRNPQGGRLEVEMPVDASNVMLVCDACGQTTRIGARILGDGSKERYCKKCGAGLGQIAPPKKKA